MSKVNIRKGIVGAFFSLTLIVGCGEGEVEKSDLLHLERGKAYEEQGQYKAAIIEFKNAIKKSQGQGEPLVAYAEMMVKLGQYGAAIELLDQVTTEKDKDLLIVNVRAYQGLNKFLSAGTLLEEKLSQYSGDLEVELLKGQNLLGLNELNEALASFSNVLKSHSGSGEALLGKATALVRLGSVDESIQTLNQINQKSPSYKQAQLLLAGIAINQNELERAEEVLTGLLSQMSNTDIMEPEKAIVLERLSYVLTRQGRSNEAYIYTKLLAEAFPGSNEVKEKYKNAVEKLQAGDIAGSKEILVAILADYPSYNQATQLLGVVSYIEGDNESASRHLSASVDPEIANEVTTNIYAATNLKLNDPQKVLEILGPKIGQAQKPETLALYGLAAISAKEFQKGESALLRALKLDPKNARVRLALADYYRRKPSPDLNKEWEQLELALDSNSTDYAVLKEVVRYRLQNNGLSDGLKFARDSVNRHPKAFAPNLIAGFVELQNKSEKTALEYFAIAEQVATEDSDKAKALVAIGRTHIMGKAYTKAKVSFEKMVDLLPSSEPGYGGLLEAYIRAGERDLGFKKLERYAQERGVISPYLVMIQAAVTQQDTKLANELYAKAEELGKDKPRLKHIANAIKYVEAVVATREQKLDLAREKIAQILIDEPNNLRLLALMVELEIQSDRINEARKIVGQLEQLDNTQRIVSLLNGDIAAAEKDYSSAKGLYRSAWTQAPNEITGDKLYKVLAALNENDARIRHVDSWLEKFPNSPKANMYKAISYQQRGQRIKAMEIYEKMLAYVPNDVIVLNNLGWIYFERENFKKSLELLEKAAELAPKSAAVLDSYGWVLFKSGDKKKGIELLEKAHELAPNAKEIEDHLLEAKK